MPILIQVKLNVTHQYLKKTQKWCVNGMYAEKMFPSIMWEPPISWPPISRYNSCTLVPPCAAATSHTHCCEMWLPRQHHLPIVTSQWVFTVTLLDHCHEWRSHICTCKTTVCTLQIWTKPQVGDFQQWHNLFLEYFLCKLTFSFIQINTSNIKFEIRMHQLNDKVNSTSGFDMFSILCRDFKVNFLRYWG